MSTNCSSSIVNNGALLEICEVIIGNFETVVYVTLPLTLALLLLLLILTVSLICCCCKQQKRKKRMYVVDEVKDGGKNMTVLQILHHGIITDKKFSYRE